MLKSYVLLIMFLLFLCESMLMFVINLKTLDYSWQLAFKSSYMHVSSDFVDLVHNRLVGFAILQRQLVYQMKLPLCVWIRKATGRIIKLKK